MMLDKPSIQYCYLRVYTFNIVTLQNYRYSRDANIGMANFFFIEIIFFTLYFFRIRSMIKILSLHGLLNRICQKFLQLCVLRT
jgi:hypothetical protein